jgi:cell division protein FtsB
MDNILVQELVNENSKLSESNKELKKDNEKLKEALDKIALPALKEYEQYESGPIRLIAKRAMDMILEMLKR